MTIWAVLGGFIGTDPRYEALYGHFAFNTALNPNGVPLFMLPMTITVFSLCSVILGSLYRVITQVLDRAAGVLARDSLARHGALCALLAGIMPLGETFAYSGPNYCFGNGVGMWGLNVLIYGAWHFAALLFYTRWDTRHGERASLSTTVLSGFATLGILMVLMAITKTFIARISWKSRTDYARSMTGARRNAWATTHDRSRRLAARAVRMSCRRVGALTAVSLLSTVSSAIAATSRADDSPRHIRYSVWADTSARAEIYYHDSDPPTFADYSHNPYQYSPKVEASVGPDKRWVLDVILADPGQWAMVAATAPVPDSPPGFHCTLAVDTTVVNAAEGPKGAMCSIRHW